MTQFLQHLIDGLSLGAIYALIALGYTMVYGVLQLINFAHGDVFMMGAMVAWYASTRWTAEGQNPTFFGALGITLVSMLICGGLGFLIERFAYRPLRNSPKINSLITAIGMSLLLEYGGQYVFGPNPRSFHVLPDASAPLHLAGLTIGYVDLVTIGMALGLMLMLQQIVFHTRIGTAMRAVSFSGRNASLMGINTDAVISFTFVLGSVLAAAGGVLYASKYPSVHPLMGLMPGLKAFVAAVLGGIGNVRGAMLGGILLGLVDQLVAGYLSSSLRDAVAFAILILILMVKPAGLLGKAQTEKV